MTHGEAGPQPGPASPMSGDLPDDAAVWLVRHGETEWSASGKHTGVSDIPLTPEGEKQAEVLGRLLEGLFGDSAPALVLSSPRERALRTAELAGLRVDATLDDLGEWNYGEYEGRTSDEIRESVPDWTIWTHGAPGGETPGDVSARADRVIARARAELGRGPVVLVGHGHFSRAVGARWTGLPVVGGANLLLGTAAPCLLGAQYGAPAIVHWNLPNPAA